MAWQSQESPLATAREIAPGVYCLGPRGRTQTNVYFVRSESSWTLIDAGWAKDGPSIKRAAETVFGAETPPASILLTHFHPDHAGSALQLARIWDCPVYLHPAELPLANGDFAAITKYAGPLDAELKAPHASYDGAIVGGLLAADRERGTGSPPSIPQPFSEGSLTRPTKRIIPVP